MSKWTDVRDNVVDALHVDDVTEDVKQHVASTLLDEVVPVIENAVDGVADGGGLTNVLKTY
ncbi:hypothetical protein [Mitsuokella multacida]|uniref:hypothetical protein n=1 Tax=Mitsuokella multacida TaxID=52226 RepID=UPI002673C66A|nr:hypothetical protein [Mitsuokella multacida]